MHFGLDSISWLIECDRRGQVYSKRRPTPIDPQMNALQKRNLAGRQDISEDPETFKFEGNDIQIRRITQELWKADS